MDDGSSSLAFDQPSHLSLLQRILRFHSGTVGTGILLTGAGMFLVWLAQHWGVGPRRGRRRRKSAKLPISAMDDDDEEEGAHSSYGGVHVADNLEAEAHPDGGRLAADERMPGPAAGSVIAAAAANPTLITFSPPRPPRHNGPSVAAPAAAPQPGGGDITLSPSLAPTTQPDKAPEAVAIAAQVERTMQRHALD